MRRKSIFITSVAILFLFSSCSLIGRWRPNSLDKAFVADEKRANETIEKILEVLENKDKEALRLLFSEKTLNETEDFDGSVELLFDFYQGSFVSFYKDWGNPGVEEGWDDVREYKFFETTYDVETTRQKYRLAIKEVIKDTAAPDTVGISSLYIILAENTDEEYAYGGEYGKWAPGIIIETERYSDRRNN